MPSPPPKVPPAPFIVTAELPADIFSWADGLRRAHFPPERNKLAAHVTLFHSFAPSLRDELHGLLGQFAGEFAAPPARISGVMSLGGGTALVIESPLMLEIREQIAEHFHGALTAQDQHTPRLHITIQNKVTPEQAKALQRELGSQLTARDFRFRALGLHIYRETHWDAAGLWPFRGR